MLKALILICLTQFMMSCQPEHGDSGVHLEDPVTQKLINLGQKNYNQSRSLPYLNDDTVSYCEVALPKNENSLSQIKNYSGFNDKILYPSASLLKIFLTAFVIYKLGVDFQFTQTWKIKSNGDSTYDAYLDTGFDPIFNIEKALYSMTILSHSGVNKIRNLYITNQSRIYLSVLTNPHLELDAVPVTAQQSVNNFKLIFNSVNWGSQTENARYNVNQFLIQQNKKLMIPKSFSVDNVELITDQNQLNQFQNMQEIMIYSAPIYKYLKEINLTSNNYLSDALFNYLGGSSEFFQFQKNQLNLSLNDLIMYTGSGLPLQSKNKRLDNLTTCRALLKTLHYLKLKSDQYSINMGALLLTAGEDQGTYESDMVFNRSVVLKTGRLYEVPTLNLSGLVSTQKGIFAFAFLGHHFDNSDEKLMQKKRDDFLSSLMATYKELPAFKTIPPTTLFFE